MREEASQPSHSTTGRRHGEVARLSNSKTGSSMGGVAAVEIDDWTQSRKGVTAGKPELPRHLQECLKQLDEYFQGKRTVFDVPLSLVGTTFQKRVWEALLAIPYGKTATYKEIAASVGNIRSTRAVGGANHRNPVSIIVPCHRVIGASGGLTGYGGGLSRKAWLLDHEKKHVGG